MTSQNEKLAEAGFASDSSEMGSTKSRISARTRARTHCYDEVNPRPADAEKPPQPEDHATLPLRRDPDGGGDGAVDDQARKACEDRQTGSRLEQRRAEHRVMTSPTTKTMPDT